ncbi:MAG: ABC transporter ATP-binding protein [Erysipelotrichaceae bacterium]|nr:ABC transporter ATP-binding protein [Erysipelotrichaceae bacterium]
MAQTRYRQIRTARAHNVGGTIGRLLSYIAKYNRGRFILALICTVLSSLTGVASSYFFTPIINNYIVPYIGKTSVDMSGFAKMLSVMASIYVAGVCATFIKQKMMSLVATGMLDDLREDLFNKMQDLPVSFFDSKTHGQIMVYFTNDVDMTRPMVAETIPVLITAVTTLVGCFVMMAILNFRLMLVVFASMLVIVYITAWVAKSSNKYFAKLQVQVSNINGYVEEYFSGQKVVKVFNHENEVIAGFRAYNDDLYENSVKTNMIGSIMFPVNANLAYFAYAIVAVIGAYMCIKGEMSLGVLASFLLYVRQFSGPVSNLSQQFNGFMMSLAGAERVFDLMDMAGEVNNGKVRLINVEKKGRKLIETKEKTRRWAWKKPNGELVELKGDVRLKNVDFSYVEGKKVLHNISLYAKPGQKIAFVGSTGAGKTTITNLLNRFYDIQKGTITYDGIDIKDINKDDLRRSIGVVLQDTNLFSGTVMDNIRYGRLDATDEECIKAAKLCNADSFITRLPQGYNTMLSANGANLSQGQRQLLNIARCAVADPPVMILDEATSSIDTHTEKLIEKGLDELMKGRTTFVIAHRLSTVRNANAIIVLEHGSIIERGDHDDLLKEKGRYYQLYTGKAELN